MTHHRVLRLGRMIAATTNFISSLDAALTRRGRFGRFIAVAPPDLEEAAQIVDYYLAALTTASAEDGAAAVLVPEGGRVRAILEPLYNQGRSEGRFFCGADLEAAVNEAYIRSVRSAIPTDGWVDSSLDKVVLTDEILAETLAASPRSVRSDTIERFLSDVDRYCGREAAATIRSRLIDDMTVCRAGKPHHGDYSKKIRKRLPRSVGRQSQRDAAHRGRTRPPADPARGPNAESEPRGPTETAWGR